MLTRLHSNPDEISPMTCYPLQQEFRNFKRDSLDLQPAKYKETLLDLVNKMFNHYGIRLCYENVKSSENYLSTPARIPQARIHYDDRSPSAKGFFRTEGNARRVFKILVVLGRISDQILELQALAIHACVTEKIEDIIVIIFQDTIVTFFRFTSSGSDVHLKIHLDGYPSEGNVYLGPPIPLDLFDKRTHLILKRISASLWKDIRAVEVSKTKKFLF